MSLKPVFLPVIAVFVGAQFAAAQLATDESNEQAIKQAAQRVAPSVVLIETTGGTERIGNPLSDNRVRKGIGPTTGLIVGADGWVISSAFNFANKPTAIMVTVPGRKDRFVAKAVATDQSRLLTLLKIDATDLPVPAAVPPDDVRIGQWAIALGRTLDVNLDHPPAISVGIVSALGRIWGKAIQTDAKISPVNYGGPLIDIEGRVIGVLIPASPGGEGETAGFEWYDSGIGFAVPLADVQAVLPKLKEGKDIRRGLLGITPKSQDRYGVPPVIGSVMPESTAAKAGLQAGDLILEIDGKRVANHAQVMHSLGRKYEGDPVSIKVRRGQEEVARNDLKMMGAVASYLHPFIGILPLRDDPELGVEVRYAYPESPAAKAGIKPGDRIMKIGKSEAQELRAFSGRDQLREILDTLPAGTDIKLEVERKEPQKKETLTVKLAPLPEGIPDQLPQPASAKKALEPRKQVPAPRVPGQPKAPAPKPKDEPKEEKPAEKKEEPKKAETGLLTRSTPARDREYWVYVPQNYDPNVAHALVVWLHGAGQGGKDAKDMVAIWQQACEDNNIILVGPKSESDTGWLASEAEFIQEVAREVMGQYTIDKQRVVAHGMGVGGQMAFFLGFNYRELVRGVATTGTVLASQPKDNVAGLRVSFFVVAGGKDPLAKDIAAAKPQLVERKFPVIHREIADMGKEYLDRPTFEELVRWIDSLDRE